jgi:hypothetical protein
VLQKFCYDPASAECGATFEESVVQIADEPSLDRCRELVLALAPLLQEYQLKFLEIGRSLHIADDDVIAARTELIFHEMTEVAEAAQWPRHGSDFFMKMVEAMPLADDDEVA